MDKFLLTFITDALKIFKGFHVLTMNYVKENVRQQSDLQYV
jgi:hypothetical protein